MLALFKRQAGFTFLGILISVAIVGILMVMSMQSYGPVMKGMEPGGGNGRPAPAVRLPFL